MAMENDPMYNLQIKHGDFLLKLPEGSSFIVDWWVNTF
jgi:hypothetical protein